MTDEQPELAAALVAFQADAPIITKRRTADMGTYTYSYADLADVWAAVREPLAANGLAVTQSLTGGATGFLGIKTKVWHRSGQTMTDVVELPVKGGTPQQAGSQITYFKRFALTSTLGLSTEDDDDGAAASKHHPAEAPPRPRTDLDDALDELDDAVAIYNLQTGKVASDFYAKHGKPPRGTDAATVRAFIQSLHDAADPKTVTP